MKRGPKPQAVILNHPDGSTIRYPSKTEARVALGTKMETLMMMIETGCEYISTYSRNAHMNGTTADLALDETEG